MSDARRVVALVPARSGSKRIAGKNVRPLRGHPLIAYTITAAIRSGAFDTVVVSTDDPVISEIARRYGADVPFLRPAEMATDSSPDIDWVRHALAALPADDRRIDAFALLRPTSPLRPATAIASAVAALLGDPDADSLRAIELVSQHPGKMWMVDPEGRRMTPLLDDGGVEPPWHSRPYQSLPKVFVQNASLEVAWARTVHIHGSIAGKVVVPWISQSYEGFDLNTETDWVLLERLLELGSVQLPDLTTTATATNRKDLEH